MHNKTLHDNKGFSLVELVICVAILAIATIPLMSAFTTSGRVIGKAQSIQNATSVAESVMEELKGSSIEQLKHTAGYTFLPEDTPSYTYSSFTGLSPSQRVTFGSGKVGANKAVLIQEGKDTPFYVFFKPNAKSNAEEASPDGELFNVVATIDAGQNYAGAVVDGTDLTAGDANSIELPVIERIDKGKHAAISKEINRLDSSAVETWKNNYRDKNHLASTDPVSTLTSLTKEVEITINDDVNDVDHPENHKADVDCIVRYYQTSAGSFAADACHVEEKVYSGTFLGSNDTRVYVFYQTAVQSIHTNNVVNSLSNDEFVIDHENIIIKSTSVNPRSEKNARKVYLILQQDDEHPVTPADTNYYMLDAGHTHMTVTADSVTVSDNSNTALESDGVIYNSSKSLMVITNLPKTMGGETRFYHKDKDDYIYALDVYVYDKDNNEKAHLHSTKDAEKTPTPTPVPTT